MGVVNKRRDRHDIVAEILKAAIGGETTTHVMYKAKLSYYQVRKYLNLLVEKGFLEHNTNKLKKRTQTMYRTTRKGIEFLDHVESLNRLWR